MAPSLEESFTKMRPRGLTKWLLVACLVVMAARSGEGQGSRVVCYYTNWSVYRPGTAKFNPQNINPYLCTHLIYAFGGFTKENTLKPFDKYQDVEKGGYAKFTGLKTYNPNLKTMIAIGGWNEGSSRFSSLTASAERRRELVKNAIKFLRQNKFDGLDLDWEYPSFRDGGKPKDRANYAKLVQELRQEFEKESEATGRPRLLVTMAVPAGIEYIDKGYDVPKLNRYLDWMNILSYDYHSAFEPAVNHHSPLFALEAASEYNFDAELNIDFSIKHYINAGADRDKLVLGIPTYGRSFTLFNPESNALGAPADGPGEQGDATREKGYLAYYEICESLMPKEARSKRQADDDEDDEDGDDEEYEEEEEEWTVVQPNPKAMGPFAYKGNQWVGYDDIDIVKKKAEYVAENKLGGIMFWSIDNDDFRGKCHGKPYPLIEAAKGALYKSLGLSEKIPPKKAQPTRKRTRPSKPAKASDEDKDLAKNTIRNNRKKTRVTEAEADEDEPTTKSTRPRATFAKRGRSTVAPAQADSTPDWGVNTPEPPTTPDPGTDFKCEEEGFFPHPRDCKKYFWCLDSGPSNLGIVAHQFTCPSGLFFNKAADSCDFSRNVVCNVKKAVVTSAPPAAPRTTTTTTTEKPETSAAPRTTTSARPPSNLAALFTTRKPIGRITAATSKTTLLARATTTVAPASVEEEDESEEDDKDILPEVDSEDPKVIKELVDLIKKLGGIEQLEKHLASRNINSGTSSPGTKTTTPATISRLLFERVLSQTRPNGERAPPQINSRGPQASGLAGKDAESAEKGTNSKRGRPQYTTINRGRPSTTTEDSVQASSEDSEEKDEEDEEEDFRRPSSTTARSGLPQYVNIRRARPSTTTEPEPTIRNALFERDNTESTSDDNDVKNGVQGFDSRVESRFKPETQESTSSKYKSIQRVRSTTLPSSSEENDGTEKTTVLPRGVSKDAPATLSPSTQSSVTTSPKYATVSRFPNTTPLEVSESTTYYSQNDATEINDINIDIASPSFASENGIIKKVDSSSVLNAQITTLSNIPKSKDEGSNTLGPDPISYTTDVTIAEKPQSTTLKVPLFAKRTRPTTTTSTTPNPPDNTDPTTSANKVSFDRKYVNVKRTRLSPSSNTSSLSLLRSRLDNDIGSDSGKEDIDEDAGRDSVLGESNETISKDRYRPTVRKIRSTTPASDENKSDEDKKTDDEEANNGSKKFVRRQSRFRVRKLGAVSDDINEETQSSVASTEKNLQSTRRFAPRGTESSFRTRKLQISTSREADSEINVSENEDQSEVLETTSKRPQPRRQFRPSFNSFEAADLSSLTALDFNRKRDDTSRSDTSTGFRNTQVKRRFRPTFTAITKEPVEDSLNSDSSITPVLTQRQGTTIRGGRFTTTRTVSRDYDSDQNTEASETSVVPRARKIIRFTPRPFTRATEAVNEEIDEDDSDVSENNELNAKISYDLNSIGISRLTAPVINVEENRIQTPAIPTSSINVTKIINSNILLGQSNNRSGLLLLRRPSASFLKSGIASVENSNLEDNLEGIQLSETNIDEKENIDQNPESLVDRPRKRIIVKKLRTRTTLSDTPITESSVIDSNKVTVAEDIKVDLGIGRNVTGKLRIRKVLKRRPATSTTAAEETATETIQNELIEKEKNISNKVEDIITKAPLQRIRVVRKKLKPIVTDEEKIHILAAKSEEETNQDKVITEKPKIVTDKPEAVTDKPEIVTNKPEIAEEFTTNYENLISTDAAEPENYVDPSNLPSTTTQRYRPSYRPPKRPLNNLSTTTEASTTAKVYSRKYNNGPYTTPILPSERESNIVTDRPRIEGLTRRPTFSVKPFGRKPFTTSRTTTTNDDDDEVDYSEEDSPTEKTDVVDKLVFVPVDQLFTRGPTARVPDIFALNQGDDVESNENNEDSEEYDSEVDEDGESIITTPKPINRFISPQRPSAPSVPSRLGLSSSRQSNRPLGFNRPVNTPVNQTTSNDAASKRFNRPVAFQQNRPTRFGLSSTQPPTEITSKSFVRKFTAGKSTSETPLEVDKEALKAKQKQLFSNPKRFTTTTPVSPSQTVTDENGEYTTDTYQETTTYIGEISNTEFDWLSMTENSEIAEITTIDGSSVPETTESITNTSVSLTSTSESVTGTSENYPTTVSNVMKIQTTLESLKESEVNGTSTTEPHHIFAVNNSDQLATTPKNTEEKTVYSVLDTSTDSPVFEMSTEMIYEHGSIKTNSFLDRLFAVSRVVEVSSKQDKHRVNSKNESRLIEAGEIMQEKKPTLDKIGEVSRFTLIKIVEGDIPKYLTNLSHEYPGENPPFNPIRIDEGRNARALNNDGGKEQLIGSESVAAIYSHKNGYADYVESFVEIENPDNTLSENKVFIVESTTVIDNITTSESGISTSTSEESVSTSAATTSTFQASTSTTTAEPSTPQYYFVPGAVDLDDKRNDKKPEKVPQKSNNPIESSTLALEGLFKANSTITARLVGADLVAGPQPFVVYAAPQSPVYIQPTLETINDTIPLNESTRLENARSITNFVKIQVLSPEEEKLLNTEKGFMGVPAAVESSIIKDQPVVNSPITISILGQPSDAKSDQNNKSLSTTTSISTSTLTSIAPTITKTTTVEPIVISIANLDQVVLQQSVPVSNEPATKSTTVSIVEPSQSTVQNETVATTELSSPVFIADLNETTTASPTDSKISLINVERIPETNSTLPKTSTKRPKLPYTRRYQNNQIKSSNITRIATAPSAASPNGTKRSYKSSSEKNIPFTTPKYNRTNSYTSGKSRFSAIRTQNTPVDARKTKNEPNKFKPGPTTTEQPKVPVTSFTPNSSKSVSIKPFRPSILRSSLFARRTTTTTTTDATTQIQTEEVTEILSSDNTIAPGSENSKTEPPVAPKPSPYSRRPTTRFNLKAEQSKRGTTSTSTELPSTTIGGRFSAFGNLRKRPTFERRKPTASLTSGEQNATEVGALETSTRAVRPTRLFVRKFTRGGANNNNPTTPSTTTVSGQSPETTTRRSFRVGIRRRVVPTLTTRTTTTTTTSAPAIVASSTDSTATASLDEGSTVEISETNDQETHSTVQQIQEKDSSAEKNRFNTKRPFFNSFKNNQFESGEEVPRDGEIVQSTGKKYSSVIKQDNSLVQRERDSTENIQAELSIDDIGGDVTAAVAVAAHQLSAAPLPTIPPYAEGDHRGDTFIRTTPSYSLGETSRFHEEEPLTRAYLLGSPSSPFVSPNNYLSTTERFPGRGKNTFLSKGRRISTTVSPQLAFTPPTLTTPTIRRRPSSPPAAFEKIKPVKKSYRTVVDYEYYDEDDIRIVGKTPLTGKVVLLHETGVIQCLDQGNFPHPESCKKFISCAKMENGQVTGWAYTCPKGLSFDPVGGICNWSAGLGCQE